MYGKKRYQRINKPIDQSVDSSVPTFLCSHCKLVKTINNPYVELSALENGKLFMYTKLCGSCAELLKVWVNQ